MCKGGLIINPKNLSVVSGPVPRIYWWMRDRVKGQWWWWCVCVGWRKWKVYGNCWVGRGCEVFL